MMMVIGSMFAPKKSERGTRPIGPRCRLKRASSSLWWSSAYPLHRKTRKTSGLLAPSPADLEALASVRPVGINRALTSLAHFPREGRTERIARCARRGIGVEPGFATVPDHGQAQAFHPLDVLLSQADMAFAAERIDATCSALLAIVFSRLHAIASLPLPFLPDRPFYLCNCCTSRRITSAIKSGTATIW